MQPSYQRGDVLFLTNLQKIYYPGDIVVYQDTIHDIPIVHRVLDTQIRCVLLLFYLKIKNRIDQKGEEKLYVLTKGDNNNIHDRGLYGRNLQWISNDILMGRVRANFPYVGYATILLNQNQSLKYLMLFILGLSVLGSRDPQS